MKAVLAREKKRQKEGRREDTRENVTNDGLRARFAASALASAARMQLEIEAIEAICFSGFWLGRWLDFFSGLGTDETVRSCRPLSPPPPSPLFLLRLPFRVDDEKWRKCETPRDCRFATVRGAFIDVASAEKAATRKRQKEKEREIRWRRGFVRTGDDKRLETMKLAPNDYQ